MKQDEALEILKTGVNVFLTGEPGSGKTHTINRYVDWLRERGVEPSVTASTGIAATHVGGMTIHSWSGIGVKRDVSDWDIEMIHGREKTARRLVDARVLIIDEVSMLDGRTLASVDRVLRALRRKVLRQEEPFGGLQVIFVGDFFQLPPVSRGEQSQFAFESPAWREANPIACYLSEQHRQEDADFLELLGALRANAFTKAHVTRLRSRMGILPKKEVATRLYTHNADVDRINSDSLGKISKPARVYEMQSRGARALVEALKSNCLSPETLELKVGAAVMFTRNNFEVGYVNGTLGTVEDFSDAGYPLVRTRVGRLIEAEPAEWAVQDGSKILARITQVPLRLAWAITVHKSQGISLDAAIIDLAQAFEYGQGYVAISRVRTLGGLFLEGFNERALQLHPKVAAADKYFRAYSDAARNKFSTLPAEEKGKLHRNFLRAIGAKEPEVVAKVKAVSRSGIEQLREKYPNLGKAWSKVDDELLKNMFTDNVPHKEIAAHFGRKPSAINARLGHLGLIEDYWTKRKKHGK
ncbi:AAA family ATPase [Candidatus Kaiserbacteria bacterium CG10_big_fil_rev_8_21_14_0_10_59_10]|uniref:AAA family ATPase n=1 Tax=Candidatus Kaiserbacteria bacterium CG10_big_fil_rev_8_21_14_0_10_59_10 TaxID=1974612 RepID=A0A2H0UAA2_9BACT|nr:MAG: AAA family ATPase [Candidatus Kaiserbacteria bacterium CG10_big_fil_rev_8_21_14_0_10_59_10]